jgi:hypothetical protein
MAISALSIKITVPMVLSSALAVGLTAFLNLGKFERTFTELESSHLLLKAVLRRQKNGIFHGKPLHLLLSGASEINNH